MSDFPWFRVYSELLSDRKLARAARLTGLERCTVVGAWVGVLALANDSPHRGELWLTSEMPLDDADVSSEIGLAAETWGAVREAFVALGMLAVEDGALVVVNWATRQYLSDSSTARVRRHRARKRREREQQDDSPPPAPDPDQAGVTTDGGECNDDVTLQERCEPVAVTSPEAETEAETETEAEAAAAAADPSENAFVVWEKASGTLSQIAAERLGGLVDECEAHRLGLPRGSPGRDASGDQWVRAAIEEMVSAGVRRPNLRYISSILTRWQGEGYQSRRDHGNNNAGRSGDSNRERPEGDGSRAAAFADYDDDG